MTETKQYISTQAYKGARDFFPEDMRVQNYIYDTWKKACQNYGFEQYDFPILEPLEIFAAKTGQEIVNDQLYWFTDKGDRKIAIRPELTPGTVRMLAQKYGSLPQPVKWFMIGNNWRFEKPQKGRGREFYQLEANIFGVSDVLADFEIFSLMINIMSEFGATSEMYEIKLSDRRLITCLLKDYLKLDDLKAVDARRIMDKRLKISKEDFFQMLSEKGIAEESSKKIEAFMQSNFDNLVKVIPQELLEKNDGYLNIKSLLALLSKAGLGTYCRFDPSIIRGFDYSDGLVYEVFDKNPENRRSMFGGERFDRLINIFGNFDLPATGFAMGDVTLKEFLLGWKLLNEDKINAVNPEYFVTLWPEDPTGILKEKSLKVADTLRTEGKRVFTWITPNTKLDKQLKYADKKSYQFAVIIGDQELNSNTVTIKDLKNGQQTTLNLK